MLVIQYTVQTRTIHHTAIKIHDCTCATASMMHVPVNTHHLQSFIKQLHVHVHIHVCGTVYASYKCRANYNYLLLD